ncbi:MAG: cobyrinate a,c-diamide synthase [Rhodobacteraceae bacterium]|nr:cobyrinate a,c-diamide synthase [Paracoccaceae bacterium]
MLPAGLLVSAPASGTGKTTVTLGLLAALRARGFAVQPFKSGPDYIDPAFHTAAAARVSVNLDSWAMRSEMLDGLVGVSKGADLVIAEGAMGLFDGVAQTGETGSGASADIAARMGWPVILVLDVSGQAQSAAAIALGFAAMRTDVKLAGVVLNKVASSRHEALVRDGMDRAGVRVFGALPRQASIALPERHLGLVQADELPKLQAFMLKVGTFVAEHVDLDAVIAAAMPTRVGGVAVSMKTPAERIALARDVAFSFVYPHLIDAWRKDGATILPFSPLADEAPDDSAGVCWLPGGYPELHAGRLAAASNFREGLRAFAQTRAVHGECGGYMALGAGLVTADGTRHEMTGLLGLETSFEKRRMHMGYRLAETLAGTPGYAAGAWLRGHEFHYAAIVNQPDAALARVVDATGTEVTETGSWRSFASGGRVTGTFFHLIAEAT